MPEPKLKTIDGSEFLISQPYEPGHTINEAEAKTLNQTRSENVGNNTRSKIKEMKEAGKSEAEIKAFVTEYDSGYVITLAEAGASRKLDPVEREAQKIAKELLKSHLAQDGRKLTVPPAGETKETWADKISEQVEALSANPEVLKIAKKNVEDNKKKADQLAASIGAINIG